MDKSMIARIWWKWAELFFKVVRRRLLLVSSLLAERRKVFLLLAILYHFLWIFYSLSYVSIHFYLLLLLVLLKEFLLPIPPL